MNKSTISSHSVENRLESGGFNKVTVVDLNINKKEFRNSIGDFHPNEIDTIEFINTSTIQYYSTSMEKLYNIIIKIIPKENLKKLILDKYIIDIVISIYPHSPIKYWDLLYEFVNLSEIEFIKGYN
jgi:hypothetical protein